MSGMEAYDWNTHRRNLEKRIKMQRREIKQLWAVEQVHWQFVHKVREERSRTPDPAQIRADALGLLERLVKWDTDFPPNCWNGLAGLKELDKIIADAKPILALLDAPLSPTSVDGSPAPDAGGKEGV